LIQSGALIVKNLSQPKTVSIGLPNTARGGFVRNVKNMRAKGDKRVHEYILQGLTFDQIAKLTNYPRHNINWQVRLVLRDNGYKNVREMLALEIARLRKLLSEKEGEKNESRTID
jgi:hypothetical protein